MPPRRRVDPVAGAAALERWRAAAGRSTAPAAPVVLGDPGEPADPGGPLGAANVALAVRFTLDELAACAPGHSVEVRVPPYGAVQCVAGPRHTRGTPPNTVETDPATWLALATGAVGWQQARQDGRVRASGRLAEIGELLPLSGPGPAAGPRSGAAAPGP